MFQRIRKAIVLDNNPDPRRFGILKVQIMDSDNIVDAEPCWNSNEFAIPPIGAGVWVTFQDSEGPNGAIWLGRYAIAPDGAAGVTEIPVSAQDAPPGNAPLGIGIQKAETADFSAIGGPAARSIEEPTPAAATVYPNAQVHETPGGIRTVRDDTPGARCVSQQIGASWQEQTENGRDVRRAMVSVDFILDHEEGVVEGDSVRVVAGNLIRSVDGAAALSAAALFLLASQATAKVGSLRVSVDTKSQDADGADVHGAEFYSVGALLLKAVGDALVQGRRATLNGFEEASVTSAGDVLIEALGALDDSDPLLLALAPAMLAAGITSRAGVARVRGASSVELTGDGTTARLNGDGLAVGDGGITALLVDDAGMQALQGLTVDPPTGIVMGGQALVLALAGGNIRRAEKLRSA